MYSLVLQVVTIGCCYIGYLYTISKMDLRGENIVQEIKYIYLQTSSESTAYLWSKWREVQHSPKQGQNVQAALMFHKLRNSV